MKMVKSLLLGSAAGVVAIAGAQAADLPVKAKPVQYVKICSLYGAGFYYIPGTDTCIKIGGFVRAEYNFYAGGSFNPLVRVGAAAPFAVGHDRTTTENTMRARIVESLDVRSQTEYGTLRSYATIGMTANNGSGPAGGIYFHRAFIQLAGFTAGLSVSFFDFFAFAGYSNQTAVIGSETGGGGQLLFAYTAQLGNGLSASISVEDPSQRRSAIVETSTAATTAGFFTVGGGLGRYGGFNGWPDVVGNLRIDQSWGSAQVMGALHQVNAQYYTGTAANLKTGPIKAIGNAQGNGHPGDAVGWAVGAGLKFNLPMLGKGDDISMQFAYAKGAAGYVQGPAGGVGSLGWFEGSTLSSGPVVDAVYDNGTAVPGVFSGLQLSSAWGVGAGYEHNWNPMWATTVYGGYIHFSYGGTVAAWLAAVAPAGGPAAAGFTPFVGSPDFSFWQVGSRTTWKPVKNLDLSVDVMYSHLDTAFGGSVVNGLGLPKDPANALYTYGDTDLVSFMFRAQRNFYP